MSAVIAEAIRTRSLFQLEHRVRRRRRQRRLDLLAGGAMLGPEGDIVEWFGTASDVTERKLAEASLRESEDRFRAELERQVRERTAELQASRDLLQATMDCSMDMIQVSRPSATRTARSSISVGSSTITPRRAVWRGARGKLARAQSRRGPGRNFRRLQAGHGDGLPSIADAATTTSSFNGWFFNPP